MCQATFLKPFINMNSLKFSRQSWKIAIIINILEWWNWGKQGQVIWSEASQLWSQDSNLARVASESVFLAVTYTVSEEKWSQDKTTLHTSGL